MTAPAISVIVPCHNGGRFLDGLVANLRKQTFKDFEIVIVNNGSTEQDTLDTLKRLETQVRVIHQENRFLPGARNRGFKEARADVVLPLDCDDRLEPDFLAETSNRGRSYYILYYLKNRQAFASRTRAGQGKSLEFAGPYPVTDKEFETLDAIRRKQEP